MTSFVLFRQVLVLGLALCLFACASVPQPEFAAVDLPAELSESSGLLCVGDEFISFNDSGGLPLLYRINAAGQIQQQLELSVKNTDWEAITSDGQFLYLADTGNNAGKRTSVLIHKIPLDWRLLKQPYQPVTLEISLPLQGALKAYQHDLDFEALVYQQGTLWLISKSWTSQKPARYRLDPSLKFQALGKALSVQSPDFLVTDASFNSSTEHWWLVGYTDPRKAIWAYLTNSGFQAQLARYDREFQLLEVHALSTPGQVEGLCIDQHQQIWISEEAGKQKPARLIKTGLSSR
jgi:sugar lactone lactonase YvrE